VQTCSPQEEILSILSSLQEKNKYLAERENKNNKKSQKPECASEHGEYSHSPQVSLECLKIKVYQY